MNLAQLRALVALADEGTFTTAAAALGLSQSAVSHTIASLERELGLPLVVRTRAGALLTAHGQQVLGHAREAVRRVDRITQDSASAVGRHRGTLRVAAFPSAAQLMPPLIAGLKRLLPDVAVVLLEGSDEEVHTWLAERIVELAVIARLTDGQQGASAPERTPSGVLLAVDRFVAVLRHDHPLAAQASVRLAELEDDPFLLSGGGCEPLLRQLYDQVGLTLRPARHVRDPATLLAMIHEQLGIAVVPALTLPPAHDLAVVPINPPAHRALHLVPADEDQDLPAAARLLLDLARQSSTTSGITLDAEAAWQTSQ